MKNIEEIVDVWPFQSRSVNELLLDLNGWNFTQNLINFQEIFKKSLKYFRDLLNTQQTIIDVLVSKNSSNL